MTYPKISIDLNAAVKQDVLDTSSELTAEEKKQKERMQALAMAIFHAFGEVFHLYTHGVYQEATFATSYRYNHDGGMVFALTACPYGSDGNVDEAAISPTLDRDIESFFKYVATHCGFQDDLTVDVSSELPERRIIAASPHAVIDLIERMIEPFHRESIEKVSLRQTQESNLGESYFTAFATRCLHQSSEQGNTEDATLQHLINYMPMRTYSSIYAACAHGAWASYDKRLFPYSLQKLRVWADSILSPKSEQSPELAGFRIH
jgi:hypothetical protein